MVVVVEKKEDNHLSYFIGYHFALAARMQSGWLWYCWGEPVGETVESEDAVGETVELSGGMLSGRQWCCRGDCGAVGGNLSGRLWCCWGDCGAVGGYAVGETVVLLGGTCRGGCGKRGCSRGDCGTVGRYAVGETVVLSGRLWSCWGEPVGVTVVLLGGMQSGGMLSGRQWDARMQSG